MCSNLMQGAGPMGMGDAFSSGGGGGGGSGGLQRHFDPSAIAQHATTAAPTLFGSSTLVCSPCPSPGSIAAGNVTWVT